MTVPGRDVQCLRQLAGRDGAAGRVARGDQRDGLDVVFDGQAGHDAFRAPCAARLERLIAVYHRTLQPRLKEEASSAAGDCVSVPPDSQERRYSSRPVPQCSVDLAAIGQSVDSTAEDAGGSRTHLNRVAAGRLAVWLQRQEVVMSPPGIEPGPRPSQGRVRFRHTPRTLWLSDPPPGNRTRPCGLEDRRAPDTLAGIQTDQCPRQESNLVFDLRRVAC